MAINSGFFFQEADAAGYYCSKSCQAKLKEEQKANATANSKYKAEPCYGYYCSKSAKQVEPCYGNYCPKTTPTKNTNGTTTKQQDPKQTKILPPPTPIGSHEIPLGRNYISIRLSDSCERTDYCPTIKELADLFDNSNKYLSGDFKFDNKTNKWFREKPVVPNVFEIYRYTDLPWILWVDPDDYTYDRSKHIIIEPQLHFISTDRFIDENRVRYEYEGLSLQGCSQAIIGWRNSMTGNETSGMTILLDVLNYFYSNCSEQIKTDPQIEIFLGSKIFADCDQKCLYMKNQFRNELKAEALTDKQLAKSGVTKEVKKTEQTCYGIYCDKKKPTIEEKIAQQEDKEKIRQERLKELEDINECTKWKRFDPEIKRAENVNCKDSKQRVDYIALMRSEYPEGIDTVQKYR